MVNEKRRKSLWDNNLLDNCLMVKYILVPQPLSLTQLLKLSFFLQKSWPKLIKSIKK